MHLSKLVFFASVCLSTGCSLINSFDDVKPLAAGAGGGSSTAAGGSSGAGGTPAGMGGKSTGGAGGESGAGGKAGPGGMGGAAGHGGGPGPGGGGSPGTGGNGGGGEGGVGAGGDAGGTDAGGAGAGGDTGGSPVGMGGTGGTDVGGASGTGGGGMGGTPPLGLIVVGGTAKDTGGTTGPVLMVLNPDTGEKMASETMLVIGVTQDNATDTWYILESTDIASGLFPTPTSETFLHARKFDSSTSTWTELSKLSVPAAPSPDLAYLVSLTDRLVYIGFSSAVGDYAVIVVDTSDAATLKTIPDQYFPLTQNVLGLAGKHSKLIGGNVEVIARETAVNCPSNKCDLSVTPITFGNAGSNPQTKQIVGHYTPQTQPGGGTPAWAVNEPDSQLAIAVPPSAATPGVATVIQVDLLMGMPAGTPFTFALPSMGGVFTQMRMDQCNKVALAADLKAARLYAVPLDGSAITSKSLSNTGQLLQFEPYTQTALTPFSSNGQAAFQAFTEVAKPLPVVFNERTADWNPPADLAVQVVATKLPPNPICN